MTGWMRWSCRLRITWRSAEEERARRTRTTSPARIRGAGAPARQELVGEEHEDPAEAEEDAAERGGRQPVAGHEEVGEEDDVDRVGVQEHRGVAGGREPDADVEETELGREEEAQPEERPALAAARGGTAPASTGPSPRTHSAADREPERGEHEGRRVRHADLDRDGVPAPQRREQQDHGDGAGVEIARSAGSRAP